MCIRDSSNIIDKIEDDGMSLRAVLRLDGMPSKNSFYKWLEDDEKKRERYARASDYRADLIFEEILKIADTTEEGEVTKVGKDGVEVTTADMIQHRRLRVDARKWMLGKMNPKKYSDKIQVDTSEFIEQPLFPDVPKNNSNK